MSNEIKQAVSKEHNEANKVSQDTLSSIDKLNAARAKGAASIPFEKSAKKEEVKKEEPKKQEAKK